MAQWPRELATPPEDPDSAPTWQLAAVYNSSLRGSDASLSGLFRH